LSVEEAKEKYIEMFGGYPAFLLMGATDDEIIAQLTKCIETGQELEQEDSDDVY
jgi:hypothetical protein